MSRRRELALVVALAIAGLSLRYAMTAHWCYAGSDSYGYLRLSNELRRHHRLALTPDDPLEWARLPLYPMLLSLKGEAPTDVDWRGDAKKGAGWLRITRAQAWADVLLMALAVWAMTRRLAGPRAALGALCAALFSPFTVPFVGAVLTETLAIALTTLALAPFIFYNERPRRAFALSGALVGLGMLLRADAILIGAAFVPALYFLCRGWRQRALCAALALAACLAVFAPWPARNLLRFGQLHAIGARINRASQPLTNVDGYWRWLRSFARSWAPSTSPWTCYYEDAMPCPGMVVDLERLHAFDSPEEAERVVRLLERRAHEGRTPAVDAEFARLAAERESARPLFVRVALPLLRAGNMWVSWYAETLAVPEARPLTPVSDWIWGAMFPLTMLQLLAIVAAGAFLLQRPQFRAPAAILLGMMAVRSLVLAYTGYCMPRYALEMMPAGWILIAVAAREAIVLARTRPAPPAPVS